MTKNVQSLNSTTEPRPHKPIMKLNVENNLNWQDIAEELITIRETEVSKYTIHNMRTCFRQFFSFCGDELSNEKKLKLNVKKFLAGKSNEYYNKQLQALRQLFAYAIEEEYIVKNHCDGVKYKPHSVKIVQHTQDTIINFMKPPDQNTYAGFRDYVMMVTMLDSGIRPNELVQLTIDVIDKENNFIQIKQNISKTRQFRIVPISSYTMQYILKLIKLNKKFFPESKEIFMTYKGTQLNTKEVRYRFCEYSKKFGTKITPYAFRHCFALFFLKNSGDTGVFSLQKIMGHTKLDMTKNYLALAQADIQQAHQQASPVKNMLSNTTKEKRIKRI